HLLTQKIERRDFFSPPVIAVNLDIVADSARRPKRVNAARHQEIFRGDAFEKFLRIIEKFACLFAGFWIVENRRITSSQFPRMKKGRPVDVFDQIAYRD